MTLPFINTILEINLNEINNNEVLEKCKESNDIVEWLKYHRKIKGLSQVGLTIALGYPKNKKYFIENIETRNNYPSKDISKKLAQFFSTGTTYFYDDYYEFLDKFPNIIIDYRNNYNISKLELSKILKITYDEVCAWERSDAIISRCIFNRCKSIFIK